MKNKKQSFKEIFRSSRVIRTTNLKTTFPTFTVFFKPDNYLKSLASISVDSLVALGFKWVIINTNLKKKSDKRITALKTWVKTAREKGLKILVLSNRPKRKIEKNIQLLELEHDSYLSSAGKPLVLKRKKLFNIVGDLNKVFMICNDFLIDTPTANALRIENTIIEDNLVHERWIDRKVNNYQKRFVVYLLKRSNMLNEIESFEVSSSTLNDFI